MISTPASSSAKHDLAVLSCPVCKSTQLTVVAIHYLRCNSCRKVWNRTQSPAAHARSATASK